MYPLALGGYTSRTFPIKASQTQPMRRLIDRQFCCMSPFTRLPQTQLSRECTTRQGDKSIVASFMRILVNQNGFRIPNNEHWLLFAINKLAVQYLSARKRRKIFREDQLTGKLGVQHAFSQHECSVRDTAKADRASRLLIYGSKGPRGRCRGQDMTGEEQCVTFLEPPDVI